MDLNRTFYFELWPIDVVYLLPFITHYFHNHIIYRLIVHSVIRLQRLKNTSNNTITRLLSIKVLSD